MPAPVLTLSNEKRQGKVTLGTKSGMLTANETYFYYIKSDTKDVTRLQVLQTVGLPIPGKTVSPSGLGVCKSLDADRSDKNPLIWWVTAMFSSDIDKADFNELDTDPEEWVPEYETFLEPAEETLLRDRDNKPFINGAGIPYSESIVAPYDNLRWDFFQLESPLITDEQIADRNNTTNRIAFRNRLPHTCLLKVRKSVVGFYYGSRRRLVEYSITWDRNNWHVKQPNLGDRFLFKGTMYPYAFHSAPAQIIEAGMLGCKDYLFGDQLDERAGLPTGWCEPIPQYNKDYIGVVDIQGGIAYAVPPVKYNRRTKEWLPINKTFYIERRRFDSLDFNSFLRI